MIESNTGKILTLLAVGTAIYLGAKNHKRDGFWMGVGVMFLLGTSVQTFIPKK